MSQSRRRFRWWLRCFNETIDWILLARPFEVDEADIVRFARLYQLNARPLQYRDRRFHLSSGPLLRMLAVMPGPST